MFSMDDRTGNIVTTVTLFLAGAAVLYLARRAFLILVISLLFADLLEPMVSLVQRQLQFGENNRTWAIAVVYLVAALILGTLGYEFGPHLVAQIKGLNGAVPQILQDVSTGKTAAGFGAKHSLSAADPQRIEQWLAGNRDFISRFFERAAGSLAYFATSAIWLFAVPILAIFILRDGRRVADEIVAVVAGGRDQTRLKRIVSQVDTMLAKYIRAQLTLAGLSFVFYTVCMLVLGFPYAVALGILGGALEFLPAVGWIASAAAILTVGFLTHAHWIWMAGLLLLWRLVQDYVNSPRIMGDSLQLQPLTVIFALMLGGQLGGVAGAYLSVPAVAILRILWLECFSTKSSSDAVPDRPLVQVGT
jgi:predicted PurR-regulated permease PerM